MAGGYGGGPGPLEVVAAEPAGDVDDFADEEEAGDDAALQGAGVERVGVDAAGGDFGFVVALGAGGREAPGVELAFHFGEGGVGQTAGLGVGGMGSGVEGAPAIGHAAGHDGAEFLRHGGEVAAGFGIWVGEVREDAEVGGAGGRCGVGGEVERDGFAGAPVGGDLQDGGAAEAAVGDEHLLPKCGTLCGLCFGLRFRRDRSDDFGGDAGEVAPVGLVLRVEDEGNEAGAGFDDGVTELAGEVVAEGGCAHLGDGEAAGGDDEGVRADWALAGFDEEPVAKVGDGEDAGCELDVGVDAGALGEQHVEDVVGGAVAEELAEGLLVVGDAVLFYQGDEVVRSETCERGFGEVGVGGEEVFRGGVEVGEVAAASAGDEDLLAGAVGVFEDQDAAAAASGFDGAHEAGSAGAEDEDVDFGGLAHRGRRGRSILQRIGALMIHKSKEQRAGNRGQGTGAKGER